MDIFVEIHLDKERAVVSLTVLLRHETAVEKCFQSIPGNEVFHAAVRDVLFDSGLMIVEERNGESASGRNGERKEDLFLSSFTDSPIHRFTDSPFLRFLFSRFSVSPFPVFKVPRFSVSCFQRRKPTEQAAITPGR
jgi:hypothetical protein